MWAASLQLRMTTEIDTNGLEAGRWNGRIPSTQQAPVEAQRVASLPEVTRWERRTFGRRAAHCVRSLFLHLAATGRRDETDAAFGEFLGDLVGQLPVIAGTTLNTEE